MFQTVMLHTLISLSGCRNKGPLNSWAAAAGIGAMLFVGTANASSYRCAQDPHVIGECFTLHGRLVTMATSHIDLWRIGTNRILGVRYPSDLPDVGDAEAELPESIQKAWADDYNDYIFADFRVCPFTKSEPRVMQYVCIDSAEHIFVQKACYTSEGYRRNGDECRVLTR